MNSKTLRSFLIVLILFGLVACNLPIDIRNSLVRAFPGIQDNPVWEEYSIEPVVEPQIIVVPNESAGSSSGNVLKPVRFTNGGSIPYTVQVESYALPDGTKDTPSSASTVVFPGSSGYLSLPLGTYTWCYYWDVGDLNGDALTDYRHALDPRPVLLDDSDNDQLEFAENVSLAVPPGSGEMEGLCAIISATPQPLMTAYPAASRATETPEETDIPTGTFNAVMGFRNWHGGWVLKIENSKVVEGHTEGYSWYVDEGTFDLKTLYLSVKRTTPGNDPCNNSFDVWFEFTDEGLSHIQTVDGCGKISTEPQIVPYDIYYK